MTGVEEWRACPGFEGWYEVSELGRVRRIRKAGGAATGRVLRPCSGATGYLQVGLSVRRKYTTRMVHVLVARAFLGPAPVGKEVNHKDGDKRNPALSNLEYVTRSENIRHSYALGLHPGTRGGSFRVRRRAKVLEYKRMRAALVPYLTAAVQS